MRHSQALLLLAPLLATASPTPEVAAPRPPKTAPVSNANHIFNAIHSSMRQFGSSLDHNGMSMFIATVPAGTEFYHGTHTSDRINATEWLAFEPEHAMIFARPRGGGPGRGRPGHGGPGHGPPEDGHLDGKRPQPSSFNDISDERRPGSRYDQSEDDYKYDYPASSPYGHAPPPEGRPPKGHGPGRRPPPHGPPRDGPPHDGPPHAGPPPHGPPPHDSPSDHGPPPPSHGPPGRRPPKGPKGHKSGNHTDDRRPPPPGHPEKGHGRHHPPGPPPPGPPPPSSVSGWYPSGWWVRRLGDAFRNPKRREALPEPAKDKEGRDSATSGILFEQEPLPGDDGDKQASGYLHTYKTKHDLRLLYLDGQSAAKSDKGTLDVQDIVIINSNNSRSEHGMFGEKQRAEDMCRIARESWKGRIDGILRMEGGFEVILCDFAAHLDVVQIAQVSPSNRDPGIGGNESFNYYRAVAARYDGIGGGRVALDYDHFVSLFSYPDALYFDKTGRPRVQNGSAEVDLVRDNITEMVSRKSSTSDSTNWQGVADMIVGRYADRIEYLASGQLSTISELKAELAFALRPFINHASRDASLEAERCAIQFLPVGANLNTIAARAVKDVSYALCSTLVAAAEEAEYEAALSKIRDLKNYLAWTTWKRCQGCTMHEICFLPIWPVGSAEDFVQPKCRSDVSMGPGNGGYWRGMRGP